MAKRRFFMAGFYTLCLKIYYFAPAIIKLSKMKKVSSGSYRLILAGLVALFSVTTVSFLSCKKKIDPEGQHITGVFAGEDCYSSPAANVTVEQGSDQGHILIPITVGGPSCPIVIRAAGAIVDNSPSGGTIIFSHQHFKDACGNPMDINGMGNITGHELSFNIAVSDTMNGTLVSSHVCFAGRK
jgi:hypothetical protein